MVTEKALALVKGNTEILPSIAEAMQLGPILVESGMFPGISSKAQAVAKILAGREIGFGPIYSLQMIDLVKGRLHLRSEAMAALINKSGRYRYETKELTETKAVIDFFADGKKVFTSIFTIEDAKRADLVKADSGWVKYSRDMLWARAMSFGTKKVCPELLAGFEPLEEGGIEEVEGEVAKVGDPPPSSWMRFWGESRRKGYIEENEIHIALGVASLKDWLASGKTLDEAQQALPNKTAQQDADELFRSEAEPVKVPVERPKATPTPPTTRISQERIDSLSRDLTEIGYLPAKREALFASKAFQAAYPGIMQLKELSAEQADRLEEWIKKKAAQGTKNPEPLWVPPPASDGADSPCRMAEPWPATG